LNTGNHFVASVQGRKILLRKKPNSGFGHLVKPLLSCCSVYQPGRVNSLIKVNFFWVTMVMAKANFCFISIFPCGPEAIIFVKFQK